MSTRLEQFYEEWHQGAGDNRGNEIRDRDVMALEYLEDCDSVFELGTGSGIVLNMVRASTKAGVDISPSAVALAERTLGGPNHSDLRVLNIDSEDLPWDANSFEGVMAVEVLEHLFDPVHALAELNRILKDRGKLVVTVPNIGYFACRLYHLRSGEMTDFHGNGVVLSEHIRFFGTKTMAHLLELTGFDVVRVRGAMKRVVASQTERTTGDHRSPLSRVVQALRPTPTNALTKVNSLFRLWKAFPSLFAVGLVFEAVKRGPSSYRHNAAIDHQLRTDSQRKLNVSSIS
jgi:SAM-dependent methyltransferase